MIEEAIAARLAEAIPDVDVYPVGVPEGVKAPFITFRQVGARRDEGHYSFTHFDDFEFDVAAAVATLEPTSYQEAKRLANRVRDALGIGFDAAGVCVYQVEIGSRKDLANQGDNLFWTRSVFTLVHDEPLRG